MADKAQGGFGNLVRVRDKDGKEYACSIEALKGKRLAALDGCNLLYG